MEDYFQQSGFRTDFRDSAQSEASANGKAVHPSRTIMRLLRGNPKEVRVALFTDGPNSTRVVLCPTYGVRGEVILGLSTLALWIGVWMCWDLLISLRHHFHAGSGLANVSGSFPVFGLGAVWLFGFSWLWFKAFRLGRLPGEFYDYLSGHAGLRHMVQSPLQLPLAGCIQMVVVINGLAFMLHSMLRGIPAAERMSLLVATAPLLALTPLILLVGAGTVRWLAGQASFTAGIALALYLLFPLITVAFLLEDIQKAATAGWPLLWPGGCVVVVFGLGVAFLLAATSGVSRIARAIEYWRAHPESHRWSGPYRRIGLGLMVFPILLLTGSLFILAFWHSLLFFQSQILGPFAWPHALAFDQAAIVLGLLVEPILRGMRIPLEPIVVGRWLLLLYVIPVLVWGGCHIVAFVRDLLWFGSLWRLVKPPSESLLAAALKEQSRTARVSLVGMRIDAVSNIEAYAAISPLPVLPRVIVLSRGAIEQLPHRCVVALLAHEIGHLRHGHIRHYAWLRLISRILMLGPSMLTALVKPAAVLECQADAFAVAWLESQGGSRKDLIDALRLIEQDKMSPFLQRGLSEGVAIAGGPQSDWLPAELRRKLDIESQAGFVQRTMIRWQLLHYMTFHSDLANYTYSPLSERVAAIDRLPVAPPAHDITSC